ncbi:MAG: glutamate-5-semialdehyde dehydrogenase [Anaerolineaceae bacterium]
MIEKICQQAKAASKTLASVSTADKNAALNKIADQLWSERVEILTANQQDLTLAIENSMTSALQDRLMLNEKRLSAIIDDLRNVVQLDDPVGKKFNESELPNGLHIYNQRVPLGVLAVIYEARPNVTVDVAGLALKSGNCAILRGGSETIHTNRALAGAIRRGLDGSAIPAEAIQLIAETDRKLVLELLQMDDYIDMVIPRGGAGLHEFCRTNSRIPVITGGIGICHLFVDETADLPRSAEVIQNAKVQRPSVCNALDTVIIHRKVAKDFLPLLIEKLAQEGVSFRADEAVMELIKDRYNSFVFPAEPNDFDTEWLSLVLGLKIVDTMDEAIEHIAVHSTHHSDGILTSDPDHARQFVETVDSAAVYVNASTRFTDGSQLGLGAEIAISTQRLHARGPMALNELTTYKWVIEGNYNTRP